MALVSHHPQPVCRLVESAKTGVVGGADEHQAACGDRTAEIRCRWAAALGQLPYHAQYTASGARPLRSIAETPHGGAWQGSWSQNRSPRPSASARYGTIEPPPASCGRSLTSIEFTYSLRPDRTPARQLAPPLVPGRERCSLPHRASDVAPHQSHCARDPTRFLSPP